MEASEQEGQNPTAPEDQPQTPQGAQSASEPQPPAPGDTPPNTSQAYPGVAQGDRQEGVENEAPVTAADEQPTGDERNPAVDQAPAATEAQDAIIGDPGLRDEQQPQASVTSADIPHRTSAPPPNAQSGVPLPEDRAAGVEPGPKGPVSPVREDDNEVPEHDASGGQSSTPPLG